ncbi:MAG: PspA/IM30 family protein [Chloroflexi bacterium]|nr:PspA/IM30 family protein [Chloroflexota bacterium]
MGILDRISTILRANINDMLDRAEDPEKMIDQIIRDMRSAIDEARGQVAEMIAQEKLLRSSMERNSELSEQWGRKAELAVMKGSDELAREALRRKVDYENNTKVYRQQWESQSEIVSKLKKDLEELESRYGQAVRNREALLARHRRAKVQQQVSQTVAQLSSVDPTSELRRMEERIALEEARAQAVGELAPENLEDRFAELEEDSEIEQQLAALKARSQPQLPPPTGSGSA